jgi:hypothetical protein
VQSGWVSVDSQVFACSTVAARDSIGRPLPHVLWGKRQVLPGQVWLFGFNNVCRRMWISMRASVCPDGVTNHARSTTLWAYCLRAHPTG